MDRKGKTPRRPPKEIIRKVSCIQAELAQAIENEGLTVPQLIEIIHHQVRELAKACHQLNHLGTRKEGEH
jgi:hypothetical protein